MKNLRIMNQGILGSTILQNNINRSKLLRKSKIIKKFADSSPKYNLKTPKSVVIIPSSQRREKSLNMSQLSSPTKPEIPPSLRQKSGSQLGNHQFPKFEKTIGPLCSSKANKNTLNPQKLPDLTSLKQKELLLLQTLMKDKKSLE